MKTIIVTVAALLATVRAFSSPPLSTQQRIVTTTTTATAPTFMGRTSSSSLLRRPMSSTDDEIAALRAAAAKAREDAARLSEELGKPLESSPAAATAAPVAKETVSMDDINAITKSIDFEGGDAVIQTMTLNKGIESGELKVWKSTNLRTFPVSLGMLEQRTAGKITGEALGVTERDVNLDDFKYATLGVTAASTVAAILSLAVLPENIGATLCYFFALIPIVFLGIGSTAPGIIAGAIASARGTSDSQEEQLDRICRHEAGHFLAGYCCGLPIKGYALLEDSGIPCVEFHPSFEGDTGREFTAEEVAALSVVAMSGSVAEALELGTAKGGENDLQELEGFLRRSQDFVGAQKQQDLTRWGALTSYNLLKANEEKYEALVQAFKEKKSVAECVAIIESR